MNGSDVIWATVGRVVVYNFTVNDSDEFIVTLEGILPPEEDYKLTEDGSQFTFTWTPSSHQTVSLRFIANDSVGFTSQLFPLVRLCACSLNKGATCLTSLEVDGGEERFALEECHCGPGWGGLLCNIDIDGCLSSNCPENTDCIDRAAPDTGFDCGPCPDGYQLVEGKCEGICSNRTVCSLDP